ncbi:MAG: presqualene diphosphate synthase HpnD [Zetaproteobacteria bacterium]|nr:presqualene diphosphate synthase HpnD [Zetaproteobacteria bacterium]
MTPRDYCEQKTRGSGSSFYYAFVFLEENKRRAMMALYAFCREVDDIADEIKDQQVAMQKMDFWSKEIVRTFQGSPHHPVAQELHWAQQHFAMEASFFHDIMEGMLMDIHHQPIIDHAMLELYCYRVAGAVGLLSSTIFGYKNLQTVQFSTKLGYALQLTNILRDLKEDARMGRIYLPQQARIQHRIADQDMIDGPDGAMNENMRNLLVFYGDAAESAYQEAIALLPHCDRESMRPSIIMAAIYHQQLVRIRQHGFDVWQHSGHISPLRKLWIAFKTWRYEIKACKHNDPESYPIRWN